MRSGSVILGLDAAGLSTSVAVALGETVRATQCHALPHGQAEALLPMVDAAMRAAGLAPELIEIIAVTVGPGSFTGIRAGLAAARGIALATGAALIGVTGFEAVAALPAPRGDPDFLLIALESRREDLYLQLFDQDQRPLADPSAVMPADLERWVQMAIGTAGLAIAGDAAGRTAAALAHRASTSVAEHSGPDAIAAIRAACRRRRLGAPGLPGAAVLSAAARRDRGGPAPKRPSQRPVSHSLKPLRVAAIGSLAALHRQCFPEDPWDAAALTQIFGMPGFFGWIARVDEEPVGFALALDLRRECEILSLGVVPDRRRTGAGLELLEAVCGEARQRRAERVVLEVAEDNAAARALYAAGGFVAMGRRPRYYQRGDRSVDALVLGLPLAPLSCAS